MFQKNGESFLSAGEKPLTFLYTSMGIVYFGMFWLWMKVMIHYSDNLFKVIVVTLAGRVFLFKWIFIKLIWRSILGGPSLSTNESLLVILVFTDHCIIASHNTQVKFIGRKWTWRMYEDAPINLIIILNHVYPIYCCRDQS